jgi:hypothetical protein
MIRSLGYVAGLTEPTDRTEPARSGTGLPVRFGREPVGYRANANLNSKRVVQTVRTGIPTGLSGIPVRFGGKPVQKMKNPIERKWFSEVK